MIRAALAPTALALALAACGGAPGASIAPPPPPPPPPPAGCEGARAHVEALYRAEAQAREPARVEASVADNTALALGECAQDPAPRSACMRAARTAAELEARCVTPLADDGREGDALAP